MPQTQELKNIKVKLSLYQAVFDNCPIMIWIKDKQNNFLKVNKLAAAASKMKPEDMENKSSWDLYPDEADGYYADDLEVINSGKAKLGIIEHMQSGQEKMSVLTDKVPWYDEEGNICGVIVLVRDITEKRKYDEEVNKAQKLKSLGILAGGLAHDLNNLLGGIIGNVDLASLSLEEGKDCSAYLDRIRPVVEKAKSLTQQLLTFAQGGAPIREVICMEHLVRGCIDKFPISAGTEIKLEVKANSGLLKAHVDSIQITQVINNLIVNAQQAMPSGGKIKICLENSSAIKPASSAGDGKSPEYVKLSIQDTGHGIHPDILENIFDPFFTTREKGSGLGLSISHSIIKKHGGFIEVAANTPEGCTFNIFLPVVPETKLVSAEYTHFSGDLKLRVLLMDDDVAILESLSGMLRAIGCNIACAKNGEEALQFFDEGLRSGKTFDVVILDLTISGGMGGKDTVRALRSTKAGFKAIVSSGYSNDPVMASPADYGFDGVLYKPFGLEELRRMLLKVL